MLNRFSIGFQEDPTNGVSTLTKILSYEKKPNLSEEKGDAAFPAAPVFLKFLSLSP